MADQISYETSIRPIPAPGQFGRSFEVLIKKLNYDNSGQIQDFEAVKGIDKSIQPELHVKKKYFIKCPKFDQKTTPPGSFVAHEFDNGPLINFAAVRLRDEQNSIRLVKMVGKGILKDHNFGVDSACLIYEFIGAGQISGHATESSPDLKQTLQKLVLSEGDKTPRILDWGAEQFLKFALDLSKAVQKLHNQGIVHSFIVPRNIIKGHSSNVDENAFDENAFDENAFDENEDKLWTLGGFGYAYSADAGSRHHHENESSLESSAKRDQYFRAPECRTGSTYSGLGYTADIYSIGAILYWLLVTPDRDQAAGDGKLSKYWAVLSEPPKDVRRLKKLVAENVGSQRRDIIIENENILKIIDSSLRFQPEHRFSCVEELIEAIEIALTESMSGSGRRAVFNLGRADEEDPTTNNADESNMSLRPGKSCEGGARKLVELTKEIKLLAESIENINKKSPYFQELLGSMSRDLAHKFLNLSNGHIEIYGHRDNIVTSLCRLLASAGEGHEYATMTLPDYWTDENLGSVGRFLVMNKHMARKGVHIRRLFLVRDDFHELPDAEQTILEFQLAALSDLRKEARLLAQLLLQRVDAIHVDKTKTERTPNFTLKNRDYFTGDTADSLRLSLDGVHKEDLLDEVLGVNRNYLARETFTQAEVNAGNKYIERILDLSENGTTPSWKGLVSLKHSVSAFRNFEIRVSVAERESTLSDFEKKGALVAYMAKVNSATGADGASSQALKPGSVVCLNFYSLSRAERNNGRVHVRRTINKVRYWQPIDERKTRFDERREAFERQWRDATSLETFVLGSPELVSDRSVVRTPESITLKSLIEIIDT